MTSTKTLNQKLKTKYIPSKHVYGNKILLYFYNKASPFFQLLFVYRSWHWTSKPRSGLFLLLYRCHNARIEPRCRVFPRAKPVWPGWLHSCQLGKYSRRYRLSGFMLVMTAFDKLFLIPGFLLSLESFKRYLMLEFILYMENFVLLLNKINHYFFLIFNLFFVKFFICTNLTKSGIYVS